MLYLLLEFIHRIFVFHSEFLVNKYPEFVDDIILMSVFFPHSHSVVTDFLDFI